MPAVAQNCCVWFEQTAALGGVMVQVGFALTVKVPLQLLVQPFESVIVTLYVPATPTVTHCVLVAKPPGPVQA